MGCDFGYRHVAGTSGRSDDATDGGGPASAELIEEVRATRETFEWIERHHVDGEPADGSMATDDDR